MIDISTRFDQEFDNGEMTGSSRTPEGGSSFYYIGFELDTTNTINIDVKLKYKNCQFY